MKDNFLKLTLLFSFLGFISCSEENKVEDIEEPVITVSDNSVVFSPTIGGPNQPNQVYVSLGNEQEITAVRDSWDFAFYSGDQFRVKLNSAIYMLASQIESIDIDAVIENDEITALQETLLIGTSGTSGNIDHPSGDITLTAVEEIVVNDDDNKVYLINMGFEVGTTTPQTGSVAVSGEERGWKKIRVLRDGENYKLLYANLNETTHKEVTIQKNTDYNFTFFSLTTESTVEVEPEIMDWDICFTVFSNVISFGEDLGVYGFSDFVIQNNLGGVKAYNVDEISAEEVAADSTLSEISYSTFTATDVDELSFVADQDVIGSDWRSVFAKSVTENLFYIIQDSSGNNYKLKFTTIVNADGERGYTQFIYEILE